MEKQEYNLIVIGFLFLFLASANAVGYTVNSLTPVNNTNSSDNTPLVTLNATINDMTYLIGGQTTAGWAFDDVVSFWDFNDYGTTMIDVYGGNNGTYVGETFNDGTLNNMEARDWVSGVFGSALEFDGVNDYVDLGDNAEYRFNVTSFSISFWLYRQDDSSVERIIDKRDGFGSGYLIRGQDGGTHRIAMTLEDAGGTNIEQVESITLNQWEHIVGVVDRTNDEMYLYVNTNKGTIKNISALGGLSTTGTNLEVGGGSDLGRYLNGTLDDVRIYNRSLSQSEIEDIYNSYSVGGVSVDHQNKFIRGGLVGYWRFDEATGSTAYDTHHVKTRQNLDATAGWSWYDEQEHMNALTFDGINDYVNATKLAIGKNTNYTVSGWIYAEGDNGGIFGNTQAADDRLSISWWNNRINCGIYNGSDVVYTEGSSILNAGQWYHFTCTKENENTNLYINGSIDEDTYSYVPTSSTQAMTIGSRTNGAYNFNGSIDDVQIYDRALTQSEIEEIYNRSVKARDNINANNTITYLTMENNIFTGAGLTETTYWWWLRLDNQYITNITTPYFLLIDTINPVINITNPTNNTSTTGYTNQENITLNYTITEENPDTCTYTLDTNTPVTVNTNGTNITSASGWHNLTLTCNDTSGRTTTQTTRFFITPNIEEYTGTGNAIINYSFYDEQHPTQRINASMEATYTLYDTNRNQIGEYNITFTTNTTAILAIDANGTFLLDSFQEYTNDWTDIRYYFLDNATITNGTTENISLYLLNTSLAYPFAITLQDQGGIEIQDALIYFNRYYPGLNQYYTIAMSKTSESGTATTYLYPNDKWHRIIIVQDHKIIHTFDPQILSCDPGSTECELTLTVPLNPNGEYYDYYNEYAYNCDYNNNTGILSCTYADTSGLMKYTILRVSKENLLNRQEICTTNTTSTSGTITCNLTASGNGTYTYTLNAHFADETLLDQGIIETGGILGAFYGFGMLINIILLITITGIGLWNPGAGMITAVFAVLVTMLLGLWEISTVGIIALMIVAAALALKTRS